MRKPKEKEQSAGFVVVRRRNQSWEVLGLRVWGKLDIPKGHLDGNETKLEAALREAREEASISIDPNVDMPWGQINYVAERPHKDVTVFIATTDQEPEIIANPLTNKYEHDGAHWVTWSQLQQHCYPYLRGAIQWAQSVVERSN
jgi:8-oxo-dGTP pyrophosphatase MutT (NUDIX family)